MTENYWQAACNPPTKLYLAAADTGDLWVIRSTIPPSLSHVGHERVAREEDECIEPWPLWDFSLLGRRLTGRIA